VVGISERRFPAKPRFIMKYVVTSANPKNGVLPWCFVCGITIIDERRAIDMVQRANGSLLAYGGNVGMVVG
jgi:hypothetical protein